MSNNFMVFDFNTLLLLINTAVSIFMPISTAIAGCLSRIKRSDCCGGHIELNNTSSNRLSTTQQPNETSPINNVNTQV